MNEHEVVQVDYAGLRSFVDKYPEENADVFDRLAYLWDDCARSETHFLVLSGGTKIVAAGSVRSNPKDENELWLMHVSVDPQYKHQGNGKAILNSIFNYAASSDKILARSNFTDEGFKYLAAMSTKLHLQYPDLRIRYNTLAGEIVTGAEPYTIVKDCGFLKIRKLSDPEEPPFFIMKKNRGSRLLAKVSAGRWG
jgi:hypothetical protein